MARSKEEAPGVVLGVGDGVEYFEITCDKCGRLVCVRVCYEEKGDGVRTQIKDCCECRGSKSCDFFLNICSYVSLERGELEGVERHLWGSG